jgi:hypothetical protein
VARQVGRLVAREACSTDLFAMTVATDVQDAGLGEERLAKSEGNKDLGALARQSYNF